MVDTPTYVIDTANMIFHGNWRSDYIAQHNFAVLLNMISSPIHLVILVTPLLEETFPREMKMLRIIATSNGCKIINCPSGSDPDQIALELAQSKQCPVISNDKFRQEKYSGYNVPRKGYHFSNRSSG